jgi:hypothetical protein
MSGKRFALLGTNIGNGMLPFPDFEEFFRFLGSVPTRTNDEGAIDIQPSPLK